MDELSPEHGFALLLLLNSPLRSELWKKQTFTNYIIATKGMGHSME